jgi:hypothetical protein
LIKNIDDKPKLIEKLKKSFAWLEEVMAHDFPNDWLITDIPDRDVSFTKSKKELQNAKTPLFDSEGIKIVKRSGTLELLVDQESALTSVLAEIKNFIPRIYVSQKTYDKLKEKKILDKFTELLK